MVGHMYDIICSVNGCNKYAQHITIYAKQIFGNKMGEHEI